MTAMNAIWLRIRADTPATFAGHCLFVCYVRTITVHLVPERQKWSHGTHKVRMHLNEPRAATLRQLEVNMVIS